MVSNQVIGFSPITDEEDAASPSEDEEDSAFRREIILQDFYSDGEASDVPTDMAGSSSKDGYSGPATGTGGSSSNSMSISDNCNYRRYDNSRDANAEAHDQEHRVRFADDHGGMLGVVVNTEHRPPPPQLQPGGYSVIPGASLESGGVATLPRDDAKMALFSSLPSSIVGNSVAMSKYLSEYLSGHPDLEDKLRNIQDPDKRKAFGEEVFPECALTHRFRTLNNAQVAIESVAAMAGEYWYPPGALIQLMHDVFVSIPTNAAVTRLGIFYVYNHLIHKFGRSTSWGHPISFSDTGLKRFCIPVITHSNRIHCTNTVHILTCINVWRQRKIYNGATCDQLEQLVTSQGPEGTTAGSHTDTNTYTVNSEVGSVKTLNHIFNMPMVDSAFDEATRDCDESAIIDTSAPNREEILADAIASGKYNEFKYSSRLSGQELILLHSSSLDLAALIEEGDKQFELLNREIDALHEKIRGL